ncbi:hypothetical protein X975_23517, partial [Stegodyphus mimosarum]
HNLYKFIKSTTQTPQTTSSGTKPFSDHRTDAEIC